jgi:saccharopine dehydrogenase-like NADP-dependent oxidoreductase
VAARRVLVLGAGKMGSLIACLLAGSGRYAVEVAGRVPGAVAALAGQLGLGRDCGHEVDAADGPALAQLLAERHFDVVVSGLPYHANPQVASLAVEHGIDYFDLTEDLAVSRRIREACAGAKTVVMPQCGLAPGLVNVVAAHLIGRFEEPDTVRLRVGALPQRASNTLKYALTWSTEGVINEYGNPCEAIERGRACTVRPLEGLESLILDGVTYEAFNTSGGLGTLAETYDGRVQYLDYKTIRYPGHCQAFRLLLDELRLNGDRETLKRIVENALPRTLDDMVLVYVSASGRRGGDFVEESWFRRLYPQQLGDRTWSAIQVATAAGLCGVLEVVLAGRRRSSGFLRQESIPLEDFMATTFGHYYA